ncbi:MAG: potassium channel family protein [Dinoroseobacter sp.]|nr:potassium channel family protein [Dinoroseobacter sp.]
MSTFRDNIYQLYTGRSRRAVWFRYSLLLFDLATVLYFIVSTPLPASPLSSILHGFFAVVIFCDLAARFWIAPKKAHYVSRVYVLADIAVLASFVLNPFVAMNLEFLRILRGLRLGHSEYLLNDLRRDWRFFREHEDALVASLNLIVFVFVTSAGVYTLFNGGRTGVEAYIDALYFTVTTLTTTGYGDITPTTPIGKMISVLIMIVGVSLFLNLARAIFLPAKVTYLCETCGLSRHDPDSVHCKHCGAALAIETKGLG